MSRGKRSKKKNSRWWKFYTCIFIWWKDKSHFRTYMVERDWDRPYNLGDNEFHLALEVDDFDKAYERHKEMGCICFENKAMGIYFISDPDNYWIEILPANRG